MIPTPLAEPIVGCDATWTGRLRIVGQDLTSPPIIVAREGVTQVRKTLEFP